MSTKLIQTWARLFSNSKLFQITVVARNPTKQRVSWESAAQATNSTCSPMTPSSASGYIRSSTPTTRTSRKAPIKTTSSSSSKITSFTVRVATATSLLRKTASVPPRPKCITSSQRPLRLTPTVELTSSCSRYSLHLRHVAKVRQTPVTQHCTSAN